MESWEGVGGTGGHRAGTGSRDGVGAQDLAHAGRSRHHALLGEGLVVRLDLVECVEIVDHQAVRLLQPLRRQIAEEVEPLEPGAVPEVESRHGIDGPALRVLRLQEVVGGRLQQGGSAPVSRLPSSCPAGLVEDAQSFFACDRQAGGSPRLLRSRCEPAAKPGTGESVTKVLRFGSSRLRFSTTCLIRKLPNDTPPRPFCVFEIE